MRTDDELLLRPTRQTRARSARRSYLAHRRLIPPAIKMRTKEHSTRQHPARIHSVSSHSTTSDPQRPLKPPNKEKPPNHPHVLRVVCFLFSVWALGGAGPQSQRARGPTYQYINSAPPRSRCSAMTATAAFSLRRYYSMHRSRWRDARSLQSRRSTSSSSPPLEPRQPPPNHHHHHHPP